jgi:preprotein translocase subunit YajC
MTINWHDVSSVAMVLVLFAVLVFCIWIGRRRAKRNKEMSEVLRKPTS